MQALLQINSSFKIDIMPVQFLFILFEVWMIRKHQIESSWFQQGYTGELTIRKSTLKNHYQFLLPPLNEQKRIISKIEELFSKIDSS